MKLMKSLAAAILAAALPCLAVAQTSPNLTYGQVPTAAQWNSYFAGKQDVLNYVPLNVAGGIMTGRLVTAPPGAATAGINLTPGTTPASPADGDMWVTAAGMFAQINGVTIGPLAGAGAGTFSATAPLTVSFPSGVVTYALGRDTTLACAGGPPCLLGLNLSHANTWTAAQTFNSGAFFPGSINIQGSGGGLVFGGASSGYQFDSAILPLANRTSALGVSSRGFTKLYLDGSTSGTGVLSPPAAASTYAWNLPAASTDLAGLAFAQTWTAAQTFNSSNLKIAGSSTGVLTINCAVACGTNTLTLPAGTTNFSSTGGTSQVVKQVSAGAALTVGQLALSDLTGTIGSSQFATGPGVINANMFANQTASTLFGNVSTSAASPSFFTIGSLSQKASPAGTDLVLIQDQAAGGQIKYSSISAIASAGSVASIAGNTGAFTLAGGVTNTINQIQADGNYSGFALQNCTLAASVSGGLLTVSVLDHGAGALSAASPCNINYRHISPFDGETNLVQQTSPLTISTFATGATLGSSNSTAFRFWVVSFNNGGTNVLALINCALGSGNVFGLQEDLAASSTPISGSATSAGVFYTPNGTTISGKMFRILGYVEYNATGLTTAGTYASVPAFVQTMAPGIKLPGDIVQIRFSPLGANSATSSTSLVDVTGATTNISPRSAANVILYSATFNISQSTVSAVNYISQVTCVRNSTSLLSNSVRANTSAGGIGMNVSGNCLGYDYLNTTSSTTYKLQHLVTNASGSETTGGSIMAQEIQQ